MNTFRVVVLIAALATAGCEDVTRVTQVIEAPPEEPAPPTGGTPPTDPPESLEATLNELGVDTSDSPRIGNEGVPLPEDYAPYGSRIAFSTMPDGTVVLGAPSELALFGFSLDEENAFLSVVENIPARAASVTTPVLPSVLTSSSDAQAPWAREDLGGEEAPALTLRDATGADIDGDGLEELATVRIDAGQVILSLQDIDDPTAPLDERVVVPPTLLATIADARIAAGDFDDDERDELLIGLTAAAQDAVPTPVVLLLLDDAMGDYGVIREFTYHSLNNAVDASVALTAGNIDYDNAEEFVVNVNEMDTNSSSGRPEIATTRLFIYEDAGSDYLELVAETPTVETPDGTYVAAVGSAAIGDIDGDELNEVLVAGISGITDFYTCNSSDESSSVMRYLAVVYEFDGLGFGRSSDSVTTDNDLILSSNCPEFDTWLMRFVFVNTVNLDGDRPDEFHINQYVFDGFPDADTSWSSQSLEILPEGTLFPNNDSLGGLVLDRSTAALTTADVNGDGRGDIISARSGVYELSVYSLTDADGFYRSGRLMLEDGDDVYRTDTGGFNPKIVAFNGDLLNEGDAQVVEFVEHQLDFTEPLVFAALAAPPCIAGIDQNRDSCTTSWGKSEAVALEGEREFTFNAGRSVGVTAEVDATAALGAGLSVNVFSFEAKMTLEIETARIRSESYEVSKSVSFETGPEEDSVVFASIPYDVYRYRVINNNVDADANEVVFMNVGLPREAVVRLATTRYYNARTQDTALKIDESVFTHRVGEIDSYPTPEDRDSILAQRRSQVEDLRTECFFCWRLDPEAEITDLDGPFRSFDPFEALPGLVSESVGVGQGSGSTEVAVELSSGSTAGRSLGLSAEIEIETVIYGVLIGYQVGGGISSSTSLTRTEGKSYVGTVGSIGDADFSDNQYSFGMFTYLQADPGSGQEFEVINYWVE
jgi:hypothetical protein